MVKNSDTFKLSIITINYNNLSGLKRTIDSVINQTWKEFEYIIIDGGSTDGSAEFLNENKENINYWVSEPDKGIYNAMNKGIKVSNGEYLLFLNSGDWLIDNKVLENVLNEIEKVNGRTDNLTVFLGSTKEDGQEYSFDPPETVTLYYLFKTALPHQAMFLPKYLAQKFPFNEEFNVVSDWIQSIEILLSGLANYKNIESVQIVAINESFGISSTQLMRLERDHYLRVNEHLFSIFYSFDDLKQTYKYQKQIISKTILHRFCWKIMCLTFK